MDGLIIVPVPVYFLQLAPYMTVEITYHLLNVSLCCTCEGKGVYKIPITCYLSDSEICAFWPKKAILCVCGFVYAWLSTWGVAILL